MHCPTEKHFVLNIIGDVLMPAVLSAKLLVEAGKVGGSAFAVGMKSAVANVVENQDPMNKRRGRRRAPSD